MPTLNIDEALAARQPAPRKHTAIPAKVKQDREARNVSTALNRLAVIQQEQGRFLRDLRTDLGAIAKALASEMTRDSLQKQVICELFPAASVKAQRNAVPLMRRLGMVVRDGDVAGEEA